MSEERDKGEMLLVKKRANLKGRLTLFKNYVTSLPDILTNEVKLELELRIARLESLLDSYNDIQSDIECISSNPTEQLSERDAFENSYYKLLAIAQSKLGMTSGLSQQPPVRRSSDSEAGSVVQHTRASVKLPVIQLPKFSGAFSNWLEFRDTYTSLIHDNSDLSATNKFHYLRSSLEGSALLVIKSLEFSAANYNIAWKLICDRFDNKKMLVANHVKSLFNVYSMQKETSYHLKKLIDSFVKDIRSLSTLGEPTDRWDTLLIHLLSSKFDSQTLFEWEKFKSEHEKQNFEFNDLLQFVRNRSELLEIMEQGKKYYKQPSHHSLVATNTSKQFSCPVCQSDHFIYYCKSFLNLTNKDREAKATSLNLCLNCLKPGHLSKKCRLSSCKRCDKKHNSLICPELTRPVNSRANGSSGSRDEVSAVSLSCAAMTSQGLLSTAVVRARAPGSPALHNDNYQRVRILLDSGSTANFITERFCKQLRLPTRDMITTINSLDKSLSVSKKCCDITLYSLHSNFTITITCVIISQITNPWPSSPINKQEIKFPSYITLADPDFYKTSDINILIGNGLFWELIENEQIKLKSHNITLRKSKLGWIIGGSIQYNNSIYCNFSNTQNLNEKLEKFWELDTITTTKNSEWSPEEIQCEQNFIDTTSRLANGRFCVTIPLKSSSSTLGDSYSLAKARFLQLEKKFNKNTEYKNEYTKFINEYKNLGHMRESKNYSSDQVSYFAPHHGVERSCSLTTKLRVVFDCSCKSSTGYSFNELQMVGPTIQDDLFTILLRFRQHNIVLTADITKCYRQIEVSESQRSLQQILWRDDPSEPLKAYELCTVTYGTASAPYLATRCLKQLAIECDDQFIKELISKDFYVDDLITGGSNVNQLVYIYNEITKQLKTGCFPLRKWCSNSAEVLDRISKSGTISNDRFDLCPNTHSKTLGINWDHKNDCITFDIKLKMSGKITKRNILSTISQLFDPMGLVSPVILYAKLTIQRLWLLKLNWDEPVPKTTEISWHQFINSLQKLNKLTIPRLVIANNYISLQLHIFTDASEEAYGASAYIRSVDDNGDVHVHLLCSKNKVAPLKPQTIPRLELCGALLGVRLSEIIVKALRLKFDSCFYWTDSSIVLGWISTPTHKLQTFVRNRIAEIQSTTDAKSWRYVPTSLNPSDYLTRHMPAGELLNCKQWWIGPQFLKDDILSWPQSNFTNNDNLPELRQEVNCMTVDNSDSKFPFHIFSSYLRMQRVMAYILRFLNNSRNRNTKMLGPLQFPELQAAIYKLAYLSQQDSFPNEFELLKSNKSLNTKNSLLLLHPFFDKDLNLIRVGGRLFNSDYEYSKKHPILLHKKHIFTNLLFNNEHRLLMHAGPQHVLYSTRQRFWTIGGRDLARYVYRNCTICNRFRSQTVTPVMGNLPKERFKTTFAFQYTAIDYAGPIMIANKEGRGCRLIKSYICVFVCFTTKAIHIELVGNLTTANFLLALKRFISRRGKPSYIYSDNGSNFVGANNEIKQLVANYGNHIISDLAQQSIKFSFCPPHSPHFGGLHESGVKSIKKHLRRVVGNAKLTFEQLYTTLTQIEAILNSRPLCPLSSNPNDLLPLTPGHFLVGKELTSTPEPDYADVPTHRLDRYQRIEQLRQQFWSRWHTEYITELQVRRKWKTSQGSLSVGDLVLIKEDNQPPLKWLLGRIIQLYPGTDGIARVADIKTSSGILRRSFSRICPLPMQQDEHSNDQKEEVDD